MKLRPTRILKPTATFLILIYLALIATVMIGVGKHMIKHGHSQHAKQHGSFICTWMCTAASYIETDAQQNQQTIVLSSASLALFAEPFLANLSIFSLHTRPPPSSLSLV